MSTNSERITAHNLLIDQAQALVDALPEAGGGGGGGSSGGLPSGITALAMGTFTPSSTITGDYEITHGLGVVPDFAMVAVDEDIPNGMTYWGCIFNYLTNKISVKPSPMGSAGISIRTTSGLSSSGGFAATSSNIVSNAPTLTEQTLKVLVDSYTFKSGTRYRWIAGVFDKEV